LLYTEDTMTPTQLIKLLEKAGLSQSEAARQLGLNGSTVRRYISGDLEIPKVVELALETVIRRWKEANDQR